MTRSFDGYYDPPEEPETTLTEDLIDAVDALLTWRSNFDCTLMPKTLLLHIKQLEAIREQMTADELPDYDDPIDAGVPIVAQQAEYEALVNIDDEVQE